MAYIYIYISVYPDIQISIYPYIHIFIYLHIPTHHTGTQCVVTDPLWDESPHKVGSIFSTPTPTPGIFEQDLNRSQNSWFALQKRCFMKTVDFWTTFKLHKMQFKCISKIAPLQTTQGTLQIYNHLTSLQTPTHHTARSVGWQTLCGMNRLTKTIINPQSGGIDGFRQK